MTIAERTAIASSVGGRRDLGDRPGRDLRLDAVGSGLVVAMVAWTWISAADAGGDAGPQCALLAVCAAAYAVSRLVSSVWRPLVPLAVSAVALIEVVLAPADALSLRPLSGPFGYVNAKGAFFALVVVAGLTVTTSARWLPLRVLGVGAAVAAAIVPFASASYMAAWLAVVVPAVALTLGLIAHRPRAAVVACGALVFIALSLTMAVGAAWTPDRPAALERLVSVTVTENRPQLWHEALHIVAQHPLMGIGPGRFVEGSPTAAHDPNDFRWAHHGFLQVAAETGIPGLLLLISVFAWAFVRLGAGPSDATSAMAAAAIAIVGTHATVDYVLHFPAVPLVAAALLGAGATRARHHRITTEVP